MPVATVDEEGTTFYFEDSGPPQSGHSHYTTIVIIHGLIFHAAIFRPLLSHTKGHDLRIVLLNMRGYPGTSPYTEDEARTFANPATQSDSVRRLGRQIGSFLEYFALTFAIPPPKVQGDGTISGGLVLMTWSLSNMMSMSLLGNAHTLKPETKTVLTKYWRKMIMFDPSLTTIGEAPLAGAYSPLRDMSLTLRQRSTVFASWVSLYFPPVPPHALSTYSASDHLSRQALADTPAFKDSLPPWQRLSIMERMSDSEIQQTTDFSVMEQSSEILRIPRATFNENTRMALWEPQPDPDSGNEMTFPDLAVCVLWCNMSMGDCIWAAKLLFDRNAAEAGSRKRHVSFKCMEGANHFPHWDDSEGLARVLAELV